MYIPPKKGDKKLSIKGEIVANVIAVSVTMFLIILYIGVILILNKTLY